MKSRIISVHYLVIRNLCLLGTLIMLHYTSRPDINTSLPVSMAISLIFIGLPLVFILPRKAAWNLPELFLHAHLISLVMLGVISLPALMIYRWNISFSITALQILIFVTGSLSAATARDIRLRITVADLFWPAAAMLVMFVAFYMGGYHQSGDCWVHLSAARRVLERNFSHATDPMVANSGTDIRYAWSIPAPIISVISRLSNSTLLDVWFHLPLITAPISIIAVMLLTHAVTGSLIASAAGAFAQSLLLLRAGNWSIELSLLSLPYGWAIHAGLPASLFFFIKTIRSRCYSVGLILSTVVLTLMHLYYGLMLAAITLFAVFISFVFRKQLQTRLNKHLYAYLLVLSALCPLLALRLNHIKPDNPFFIFDPVTADTVNRRHLAGPDSLPIVNPAHTFLSTGSSSRSILPVTVFLASLLTLKTLKRMPGFSVYAGSLCLAVAVMHIPFITEFMAHQITWMKVTRFYQGIPVIPAGLAVIAAFTRPTLFSREAIRIRRISFVPLCAAMFLTLAPSPDNIRYLLQANYRNSPLLSVARYDCSPAGELFSILLTQAPSTILAAPDLSMLLPALTHHKSYSIPRPHSSPSMVDIDSRNMLYRFVINTDYSRDLTGYLINQGIDLVVIPIGKDDAFLRQELSRVWRNNHYEILAPRRIAESGLRV